MFTDFLAECRASKLQLDLKGSGVMGAAQVSPNLTHDINGLNETPQRVAVAA